MAGAQRGTRERGAAAESSGARGAAYWLSLLGGCLALVALVAVVGFYFTQGHGPARGLHGVPAPTYSHGPGGLYDPGTTLIPNPPATHKP